MANDKQPPRAAMWLVFIAPLLLAAIALVILLREPADEAGQPEAGTQPVRIEEPIMEPSLPDGS